MAELLGWIAVSHIPNRHQNEWRWIYELSSKWCALVIDRSQCFEPPRATEYHIAAMRGPCLINGGESYASFDEAKRKALELAMVAEAKGL